MIVAASEAEHVGEPAMVSLPRIERGRRREKRTVAFDNMNFSIEARDDPCGQLRRRRKCLDCVAAEFIDPKDATAAWVAELDRSKVFLAIAPQAAGGEVLRFRQGGRVFGRLASQRK